MLALLRASSPGISIDAFGRLKRITIVSVVVVIPFDSIIVIFSFGFCAWREHVLLKDTPLAPPMLLRFSVS